MLQKYTQTLFTVYNTIKHWDDKPAIQWDDKSTIHWNELNETANDSNADHDEADVQITTSCQSQRAWMKRARTQTATTAWMRKATAWARDDSNAAANHQSQS